MFRALFVCLPFAAFGLLLLLFVLPTCRTMRLRPRLAVAAVFLVCCSKFLFFKVVGGDEFNPELPQWVIWAYGWLYSGAMLSLPLSLLFFFLPRRVKLFALPAVAWTVSALGVWNGVKAPPVREVELECPGLPPELDGYRILQLADIHVSSSARRWRTEAIVAKANAANADLVVCTGDIVDGPPETRWRDVEPLRDLKAKDGVFFVTGNHEFYGDWYGWSALYRKWGFRFLRDECVFPRAGLALGGMDDEVGSRFASLPPDDDDRAFVVGRLFSSATNGAFRVLLQHRPGAARRNALAGGVGLQLSGHTHGGVAPPLRPLVAAANGGFVRGAYSLSSPPPAGHDGLLYVSPGCGQWAGFPVRLFNDSEISLLVLRRRP